MIAELFKKYQALVYQLSRFVGIGFLNTAVDFSIANILIASTGFDSGLQLSLLKMVSFTAAVFHSFFWNKYWAFGQTDESFMRFFWRLASVGLGGAVIIAAVVYGAGQYFGTLYFVLFAVVLLIIELVIWQAFKLQISVTSGRQQEMISFIAVSVIGALINASLVGGLTKFIPPMFGFNTHLWANVAIAAATLVSLVWNFIGYKLLVFKK
ncbi:MAG: GtrA family protein [Patescibacteria group bacterium]